MASLFFYGSLRHAPLLETVLGRSFDADTLRATTLSDHSVYAVADQPFPMLVPEAGGRAEGLLASGLTASDVARLNFYEGGFAYDLVDVVLENGEAAEVYLCAPDQWRTEGLWDFEAWVDRWAAMSCHAAREVMRYLTSHTPEQVAAMFPQIRARAWSRVLGARTHAGQGVFDGKVEINRQECAYVGFFAMQEVSLRHSRFGGGMSPMLERSYLVGGDAALVLPYDPKRDRVLLVEQMRVGPLGRGDPEIWHLEPIAGRIDPGESPEQTARREAREEANLEIEALETVARGYCSPGDSTGYFHIFVGLADLPDDAAVVSGLESEAEDIRSRLISYTDFIDMAEQQAIANTPLALLAYWLVHHRCRLRS
ncbi:NUDIX domain-containing protein [Sulfitobacter sp.]|uniref:NUDIX domain-containing protein n=1 Tax=Sulfitobacter sp. TaxID=1903071 RepID=UPI003001A3C9